MESRKMLPVIIMTAAFQTGKKSYRGNQIPSIIAFHLSSKGLSAFRRGGYVIRAMPSVAEIMNMVRIRKICWTAIGCSSVLLGKRSVYFMLYQRGNIFNCSTRSHGLWFAGRSDKYWRGR